MASQLVRPWSVHDGLSFCDEVHSEDPRTHEANVLLIDWFVHAASGGESKYEPQFVRAHCQSTKPLFAQVNADRVTPPERGVTDWWRMRAHKFCELEEEKQGVTPPPPSLPPLSNKAQGKQPAAAGGWDQRAVPGQPPNAPFLPRATLAPARPTVAVTTPTRVRRGLGV